MKLVSNHIGLLAAMATAIATVTHPAHIAAQTNEAKPTAKTADTPPANVVVEGKGITITRSQLDDEVIRIKATLAAQGRQAPPGGMEGLDAQVLERMIEVKLVQAKATEAEKAKAKESGEKRVAEEKAKAPSEESFNRQLRSLGLTPEEFLARLVEAATVDAVLERELNVKITDEDIKKYYDDHPARFEQPEMVRVNHILLATRDPQTGTELTDVQKQAKRKQAEELLKRAKDGEDFAKLAKTYSEDPGSKDRGGEYFFPRGVMAPEFEAAAFSLNTNQVSDVVTTQFGYHIIKLTEKDPAQKISLEKATPNIKQLLTFQEMQKLLPAYMEKLKQASDVKLLDPKLKLPEKETPEASTAPTSPAPKESPKEPAK